MLPFLLNKFCPILNCSRKFLSARSQLSLSQQSGLVIVHIQQATTSPLKYLWKPPWSPPRSGVETCNSKQNSTLVASLHVDLSIVCLRKLYLDNNTIQYICAIQKNVYWLHVLSIWHLHWFPSKPRNILSECQINLCEKSDSLSIYAINLIINN